MRRAGRIGAIASLVFAGALTFGPLNGSFQASAARSSAADLSSGQAVDSYLASLGFDPAAAVRQTGTRNYVGPSCPGAGWNCRSSAGAVVVQQASADGVNVFQCTASSGGSSNQANDTCVVVQTAPASGSNFATCLEEVSGTAPAPTCTITQQNTGGSNKAGVTQEWSQQSGDAQTAAETATITQTNTTGLNRAQIRQMIGQAIRDGSANQSEEATQFACIQQDSPSGTNQATINQQATQNEQSTNANPTQLQNDLPGSDHSCGNQSTLIAPNVAGLIQQDQGSAGDTGQNQASLAQTLHQKQLSGDQSGAVSQQQGSNFDNGGLEGDLEQTSTGLATASANQQESQLEDAETSGSLAQTQNDPHRCCSNQSSNPNDQLTLTQSTTQNADSGASQFFDDQGNCTSSGTCDVTQQINNNTISISQSCTPGPCAVVNSTPSSNATRFAFDNLTYDNASNQQQTITFDELPFQPVDGLTFNGVTFGFTVGAQPSTDANFNSFGPGQITYVQDPSLEGNAAGVLTLTFASPTPLLKFGVAIDCVCTLSPGFNVHLFGAGNSDLGTTAVNTQPLISFSEGQFSHTGTAVTKAVITFDPTRTSGWSASLAAQMHLIGAADAARRWIDARQLTSTQAG